MSADVIETLASHLADKWVSENRDNPLIRDFIERHTIRPMIPDEFLFLYERQFMDGQTYDTGTRAKNELARVELDRLVDTEEFWMAFVRRAAEGFGIEPLEHISGRE
jgi:hypothetical protein